MAEQPATTDEFPPYVDPNETEDGDLAIAFCPRDLEILIEILSVELSNAGPLTQKRECILDAITAFSKARQHAHSRYGYETKNPPKGRWPKRSKIK